MAGPLNGLGGQQIPLATTYKPGQNDTQLRAQEERPDNKKVRSRNAPTEISQPVSKQDELLEQRIAAALSEQRNGSGEVRRGTVLDITV